MKNLVLFLLFLVFSVNVYAGGGKYLLIVNKSVKVESISKKDLKKVYRGKLRQWDKSETPIKPCYVDAKSKEGKVFFDKLLKVKPNRFKKFWLKMIFKGKGPAPVEETSSDGVIDFVSSNSGGVGIIPESAREKALESGAKIIGLIN